MPIFEILGGASALLIDFGCGEVLEALSELSIERVERILFTNTTAKFVKMHPR